MQVRWEGVTMENSPKKLIVLQSNVWIEVLESFNLFTLEMWFLLNKFHILSQHLRGGCIG